MVRSNFGAVRLPLLGAAVLASFAASLSAQVVEKGRTYADLVSSHPCNSGNSGRLARVTDAQSSSSIGGGGGSVQVWAVCDGVDTWTLTTIGGSGGGVTGLTSCADGTALADNALMRADGTTKCQGSTVTLADSTGNLQWEGTTADAFEGNFTFADPTADWTWAWGAAGDLVGAGSLSIDNLRLDGNTISSTDANGDLVLDTNGSGVVLLPQSTALFLNVTGPYGGTGINSGGTISGIAAGGAISYQLLMTNDSWARLGSGKTINWNDAADMNSGSLDTSIGRSAAGIVKIGNAMHLTPIASPPRTCDATAEGDIYSDTSHALCWCDASTWQKLSGAGTCA